MPSMSAVPPPPAEGSDGSGSGPTGAALLSSLSSRREVAETLGVTWQQVAWLLCRSGPDGHERVWTIKRKWGGTREIRSPKLPLLKVQENLRHILDDAYSPRKSAHGYVQGRSIRTNATPHVDSQFV